MTATLSILIPTLSARRDLLSRLMECLTPQLGARVTIETLEDDGELTTGEKRQRLIEEAGTPYVAFVDDDDLVSGDYCTRMLMGIKTGADVVGFKLRHFEDGHLAGYSVHSLTAERWHTEQHEDGLRRYWRTPNHLNPIRTEIARSIGYKAMTRGEDADYSRRLFAAHGATMREHFVDAYVYDYFSVFRPPPPITEWDDHGRLTLAGARLAIQRGGTAIYMGRSCTRVEQLEE